MIVDAHHHAWLGEELPLSWMAGALAPLAVPAPLREYASAASALGVRASVLVDGGAPARAEQDAAGLLAAAAASPVVAGVVIGLQDGGLRDPALGDRLAALASGPGGGLLAGVRWTPADEGPDWARDRSSAAGLDVLARRGLALDVIVRTPELGGLADLAARADGVAVIVDHLAKAPFEPGGGKELRGEWAAGMAALARRPGVHVKVSGIVQRPCDPALLAEAVKRVLDLFGAHRVMIGSDWPVCTVAAPLGPPPSFGPVAVRVVGFQLMGALPSVVDRCEVSER